MFLEMCLEIIVFVQRLHSHTLVTSAWSLRATDTCWWLFHIVHTSKRWWLRMVTRIRINGQPLIGWIDPAVVCEFWGIANSWIPIPTGSRADGTARPLGNSELVGCCFLDRTRFVRIFPRTMARSKSKTTCTKSACVAKCEYLSICVEMCVNDMKEILELRLWWVVQYEKMPIKMQMLIPSSQELLSTPCRWSLWVYASYRCGLVIAVIPAFVTHGIVVAHVWEIYWSANPMTHPPVWHGWFQ